MNKKGLTLMELAVAMLMMGVIAACSVPMLGNVLEKNRSNEAISFLKAIHMGQKIYHSDHGEFCPPLARFGGYMGIDGVNNDAVGLGLDLTPIHYTYSVQSTNDPDLDPYNSQYIATASRGNPGNKIFTINELGVITESGTYD